METEDQGLTTQPVELSLREQLAENLANAREPEPATPEPGLAPAPSNEGAAAPAAAESAEQKAGRLAGRTRDDQGRLLPGKPQATTPQESHAVPPPAVVPLPAAVVAPKRPTTWKKDYWGDWDALASTNPKLAEYINQREGEYAKGVSTYKQEWDNAKPILDAIQPFQAELQQHGIAPERWIQNLGAAHRTLALGQPHDKMSMMQKMLADYQIPAQLAVQGQDGTWQLLAAQPQAQRPAEPQFRPQDIQKLVQQELQSVTVNQKLQDFLGQVEEKYPHYETVRDTMVGLLQAGLAQDYTDAYEAALRHPRHAEIFDAMQLQQREADAAKAREVQQATVKRARSNVVSVASSTPSGTMSATGDKSLRDQLTENVRAAFGGRV